MIHRDPAVPSDAYHIDLRDEDRAECERYGRGSAEQALEASIRSSPAATFRDDDGTILAIFGVSSSEDGSLHPWMVSGRAVSQHRRALVGVGRYVVERLRQCAGPVYNFISKDAHSARRFITSLGFVIQPQPGPFDLFYLPCASTPEPLH